MSPQPLVSIVTPFYNTRPYLADCIESVLLQTYQDWEYLLVDNCSTDGSSEIAARYASRFPQKIRLVRTKSFLSQVQNYNYALSLMSRDSAYCKIVQADDWIFPDCVRSMVELADAYPRVGIVSAYELAGDTVLLDGLRYPTNALSGRDVCRLFFLNGDYLFGTPTSLLMRSELVRSRQPFYDERYAPFEDLHVCFDVLTVWDFGFVHQVLTYTRTDNPSILSPLYEYGFALFTRLAAVVVHGRTYLSPGEYSRCLKAAEQKYFLFLGKAALRRKKSDFWEFHRNALSSINRSLRAPILGKWMLLALLECFGNPKHTLEVLRQHKVAHRSATP